MEAVVSEGYKGFHGPALTERLRMFAWTAISETGTRQIVAEQYRQMQGWGCSPKQAASRVSQYLNPRDPHAMPADFLLLVAMLTDRLRELRSIMFEAEEAAELFEHKRMAKVAGSARREDVA